MLLHKSSRSEEAHWSSFRKEVLQLQESLSLLDKNNNGCSSLSTNIKASRDVNVNSKKDNTACYDQYDSKAKKDSRQIQATVVDENDTPINNIHRDTSTETNKVPQCQLQLSPLDELDDDDNSYLSNNDSDNDKNYSATQPQHHQYLELIGMEEVDRSICSLNNKSNLSSHDNNCIISTNNNNNAMSHASQNTNALSIATQELAEMKLKLALTESERDELEFELMQSR